MRFNADTEEVETLVDGKVLVSSGPEAFTSWVSWHNEKHKPITVSEPVEPLVVTPAAPVEEAPVDVENPVQETVDTPTEE